MGVARDNCGTLVIYLIDQTVKRVKLTILLKMCVKPQISKITSVKLNFNTNFWSQSTNDLHRGHI